jgi:heme-degrading monooxygenase HmoA
VIARIWRGWAPMATADDYQRHYETEVGGHLAAVSGFRGGRLLRQEDGREVMFTSITFFTSLDAVQGFAGDDYERAVVEDAARRALSRWDDRVSHHEVVSELDLSISTCGDIIAASGHSLPMPGFWVGPDTRNSPRFWRISSPMR